MSLNALLGECAHKRPTGGRGPVTPGKRRSRQLEHLAVHLDGKSSTRGSAYAPLGPRRSEGYRYSWISPSAHPPAKWTWSLNGLATMLVRSSRESAEGTRTPTHSTTRHSSSEHGWDAAAKEPL
jgi:hypothetical protein